MFALPRLDWASLFNAPGNPGSAAQMYSPEFFGGTVAPTLENSSGQINDRMLKTAQQMTRGRTSTILTGGAGENESLLNTSRILLGR